jgi:hypothetical protein
MCGRSRSIIQARIGEFSPPNRSALADLSDRYQNNVSGHLQHDPPPHFRGGLLADDMGLGKTLRYLQLSFRFTCFLQSRAFETCLQSDESRN